MRPGTRRGCQVPESPHANQNLGVALPASLAHGRKSRAPPGGEGFPGLFPPTGARCLPAEAGTGWGRWEGQAGAQRTLRKGPLGGRRLGSLNPRNEVKAVVGPAKHLPTELASVQPRPFPGPADRSLVEKTFQNVPA